MIELNPCSKCGGKGKLCDGDHRYDPKNKTIKFLNNKNGFTTIAECKNCERWTDGFDVPIKAIDAWNKGEVYNEREWKDKLEKEYTGKIYTEEEIKNFIFQTDWKTHEIKISFTNGDYEYICYNEDDLEYFTFEFDILEEKLEKVIEHLVNCIKQSNLKVKEMKHTRKL